MNHFDLSEAFESIKLVQSDEPFSTDESTESVSSISTDELNSRNFEVNYQNVQQKIESINEVYSKFNSKLEKLNERYRGERDEYNLLFGIVQKIQDHQEEFRCSLDFEQISNNVFYFKSVLNENAQVELNNHVQEITDQINGLYNEFNQIYQQAMLNNYEINIDQLDSNANQLFSIFAQFEDNEMFFDLDLERRAKVFKELKISIYDHTFPIFKKLANEFDSSSVIAYLNNERLIQPFREVLVLLSKQFWISF